MTEGVQVRRRQVGIRLYSDECDLTFHEPRRHVYWIRDLINTRWLGIHPVCCGSHTPSHSTELIQPDEYATLGEGLLACTGCARWLRWNPHIIMVKGLAVRVADADDVTITQRGLLDVDDTQIIHFLPLQRNGEAHLVPAGDLVGT
jgi:hypothetical protein